MLVAHKLHCQTEIITGIKCSPELGEERAVGEELVNESLLLGLRPDRLEFVDHLPGRGEVVRPHGLFDGEWGIGLCVAGQEHTAVAASPDFIQIIQILELSMIQVAIQNRFNNI